MAEPGTSTGPWTHASLPRPFTDATRDVEVEAAVNGAYDWHAYLRGLRGDSSAIADDARRILARQPVSVLNQAKVDAALVLVTDHDASVEDVARQVEAAARFQSSVRLHDVVALEAFVDLWTGAHARVIGAIGGIGRYTWQQALISEISRGFFLTASLMTLPEDLEEGHVLFPLSDATAVGMEESELMPGNLTPGVRRFLWKQTVRARDSFAQSQRLIDDLDRRQAASFRRWWFAALEVLNQIERNKFDVWSHPPRLTPYRRAHVRFQARFGRTTFR